MRKSIFVVIATALAFSPALIAGNLEAPRGILGIEWGESLESARAKMLKRPGVIADTAIVEASHQRLLFQMGYFLAEQVDTWNLEFVNNKFFWAKIILDSENFSEIQSVLLMRYGTPAISSNDMAEWQFPEATVRFVANSPVGHTSVVFWNTKLFNSKSVQEEKKSKIRMLDKLRDLD